MIKTSSEIELHVFKGKTPEKCGAKCFLKDVFKNELHRFHRHNYIEFEYLEYGAAEHDVCGTESTLTTGDFYAIGTEDFHKIEFTEPGSIFTLSLYPRLLPAAIQKLLSQFDFPVMGNIPKSKRREMSLWHRRIRCMLFHDEPCENEKIMGYLLLILSTALEYSKPITKKKERGKYKHIAAAIEYIEQHYNEDISLDDVAKALYLSPNHLSKLFSEANGISISEYLTEYRLEMAKHAINTTKKSITDIAMECGFGSFSSFSRSWKRYFGINPRDYKKLLQRE